ncbi:MAG TPA: hypothetical protein VFO70_11515 [Chitinophagaceae bacterium]|nr:hypothetical protein [Chitinophagaceae bacterium]
MIKLSRGFIPGKLWLIAVIPFLGWMSIHSTSLTAEELLDQVKAKLEKVRDYEAKGKMRTNVIFIKAPVASVKVYFKKPDKIRIVNENGISFIPKGSVNINLNNILIGGSTNFDIIDLGREKNTNFRIIKLLPRDEGAEIVLSTLYIDETRLLIMKARTTTRENGTYELDMSYGKYADYGLADKVIFSFNTKDYKLPKGVTFDYDDGKKQEDRSLKNKKGKVEIIYSNYSINKGIPDTVFK